ncbi:MAG: hypothetical protein ABSC04_15625 [Syntrophobacteraceae bacterium]|jgi:hypothetical protein
MASSNPKHNSGKSVNPKDTAGHPTNVAPGKPKTTAGIPPPPKKRDDSDNSTQDRKFWRKKPIEITTLIIVLAYTVISFFQWWALSDSNQINQQSLEINRQSVEISRQSLVSVQRAFVTWKGFTVEPRVERWESEEKKYFAVKTIWENSGTTPAIRIIYSNKGKTMRDEPDDIQFKSQGQPSDYAIEALGPKYQTTTTAISIPESYFGKEVFPSLKQHKGLPPKQHKIVELKQGFFIWGWVVYADDFPGTQLHVTEFCRRLHGVRSSPDGSLTFDWDACRHHNCVDNYCEDYHTIANIMPK